MKELNNVVSDLFVLMCIAYFIFLNKELKATVGSLFFSSVKKNDFFCVNFCFSVYLFNPLLSN